jgi:hypothetical protein
MLGIGRQRDRLSFLGLITGMEMERLILMGPMRAISKKVALKTHITAAPHPLGAARNLDLEANLPYLLVLQFKPPSDLLVWTDLLQILTRASQTLATKLPELL